jgi:hypothetical protein
MLSPIIRIDTAWLEVNGSPVNALAYSDTVSYQDGRLSLTIPFIPAAEELNAIAIGKQYEIVLNRCDTFVLEAYPQDKVTSLINFTKLPYEIVSPPEEIFGYYSLPNSSQGTRLKFVERGSTSQGEDLVALLDNNQIECSPNLRGKTLKFRTDIVYPRWVVEKNEPLSEVGVRLVGADAQLNFWHLYAKGKLVAPKSVDLESPVRNIELKDVEIAEKYCLNRSENTLGSLNVV